MFIKDQGVTEFDIHFPPSLFILMYIYELPPKQKSDNLHNTVKSLLLDVLKYWVQKRNVIIESPLLHLFKFLIVKLSLLLKVLATFVSIALKNLKHNFES